MGLRKKVFGNTLIQLIGKGITTVTSIVITLIIAREYGASVYGDFTKITTYISIGYLLIDFGFNAVYLEQTEKEQNKDKFNPSFGSLLTLRLIWSLIIVFFGLSLLAFLPYDAATSTGYSMLVKLSIILMMPTLLTLGIHTSYNALYQKELRYDKSVIASVLGSLTTLLFVLFVRGAILSTLIIGYTVGGIVLAFVSVLLYKGDSLLVVLQKVKTDHIWKLFTKSLPLGLTLLVSLVNFRADIFVLTAYKSSFAVGIYGLATKLFDLQIIFATYFMNAMYPILLRSFEDKKRLKYLVGRSLAILLSISIVMMIFGFIASGFLSLIRVDFQLSATPLKLLSLSLPLFYASALFMWVIIASGKRWQLFWIYSAGMTLNVVLNIIFVPIFSYNASAVITGISEAVVLLLLIWVYYKNIKNKI